MSGPSHGSFDGSTYTPDADYVGEDSFSYSIEDSTSEAEATATFDVQGFGIDAQDDFFNTAVNTPVSGNVLANDSATAGTTLTASGDDPNVQLASDGTFTFTPPQDFIGTYTFTYYASAENTSASAILSISVSNPPAPNDDAYTTQENVQLVIDAPGVLGNDTDADGGELTASFDSPSHGSVSGNSDGSFTYTDVGPHRRSIASYPNTDEPVHFVYRLFKWRHGGGWAGQFGTSRSHCD
jgi:hypothetical protein